MLSLRERVLCTSQIYAFFQNLLRVTRKCTQVTLQVRAETDTLPPFIL